MTQMPTTQLIENILCYVGENKLLWKAFAFWVSFHVFYTYVYSYK